MAKKSETRALNQLKLDIIKLDEQLKANKGAEATKLREFVKQSRKAVDDALKGEGVANAAELKEEFSAVQKAFDDFKKASAPEAKAAAPEAPETKALVKNAPKDVPAVESFPAGDKGGKYLYVRGARKIGDNVERIHTVVRGENMAEAQVKAVTWLQSQGVDIGEQVGSANKNFRLIDFEEAGVVNPVRTAKESLKPTDFAQSIEARYDEQRRNFLREGGKKSNAPATLETLAEQEIYDAEKKVVGKSKTKKGKGKEAPEDVARAGGSKAGDVEEGRDARIAAESKADLESQMAEVKKKALRKDALKQADDVIGKGVAKAKEFYGEDGVDFAPDSQEMNLLKERLAAGTQGMDEAGVDAFEKMKRQVQAGNFKQAFETAKQVPTINEPIALGKTGQAKKPRVYAGKWVDPKALIESEEWKNTLGMAERPRTVAQKRLRVTHLIETGVFNTATDDVRGLVGSPQLAVILQNDRALNHLDKVGRNAKIALEGPKASVYQEVYLNPTSIALNKIMDGRENIGAFDKVTLKTEGNTGPFVKSGDLKRNYVSLSSEERAANKSTRRLAQARKTEELAADEGLTSADLENRVNRVKQEIANIEEKNPKSTELTKKRSTLNDLERRYKAKLAEEQTKKTNAATNLAQQGETGAVRVQPATRTNEEQLAEVEKQLERAKKNRDPITAKFSKTAKGQVSALEQRRDSLKQAIEEASQRPGVGAAAMGVVDMAMEAAPTQAPPPPPPAPVAAAGPNLKSQKLPRTPARRAMLQARAAKMGLGRAGMGTAGRVGMQGLRFLGPLAAIFGAYQIASALKGQTVDEADERRLRVMQALGAVGGGMGQEMQQREQIRAMSRMVDLAAIQRQQQRDELNKQYTGNMALDALLRGQEATLSTLAQPSRPSVAEMMMRM